MLQFDLTMRTGLLMIFGLASIVSIFVIMIVLLFTYIRVLHIIISVIGMILLSMVNIKLIYILEILFNFNIIYHTLRKDISNVKSHYYMFSSTCILMCKQLWVEEE